MYHNTQDPFFQIVARSSALINIEGKKSESVFRLSRFLEQLQICPATTTYNRSTWRKQCNIAAWIRLNPERKPMKTKSQIIITEKIEQKNCLFAGGKSCWIGIWLLYMA
jgi:hypothetical protein